jgi:transcriptional regulator with XRE-family HTH domain
VQSSIAVIADLEHLKRVVGANIRTAREDARMNQQELAARLGAYDYRDIIDYEKGKRFPTNERMLKIAIVLDHSYAWFFEPHETKTAA